MTPYMKVSLCGHLCRMGTFGPNSIKAPVERFGIWPDNPQPIQENRQNSRAGILRHDSDALGCRAVFAWDRKGTD